MLLILIVRVWIVKYLIVLWLSSAIRLCWVSWCYRSRVSHHLVKIKTCLNSIHSRMHLHVSGIASNGWSITRCSCRLIDKWMLLYSDHFRWFSTLLVTLAHHLMLVKSFIRLVIDKDFGAVTLNMDHIPWILVDISKTHIHKVLLVGRTTVWRLSVCGIDYSRLIVGHSL